MAQYQDHMLILKSRVYRESDVLLTLFGIKSGKIGAVAKGARRPKSRLAGVYPLSYVICQLYHGRSSLDTVNGVDLVEGFPGLQKDLSKLSWALLLADLVDEMFSERDPAPEVVPWIIAAWDRLAREGSHLTTALSTGWQLLKLAGYIPRWDTCDVCGDIPRQNSVGVDWDQDVMYCSKHLPPSSEQSRGMEISLGSFRTWQGWMALDVTKLGNYEAKGIIGDQLFFLFGRYIERHIGRMPRSWQFVREVENIGEQERNRLF
ncbi:MAG: DNA repair protein RecO [Firmicutes bacterium]|nr:DNA repair protein RecO [Bacillota bacterium]